MSAGGTFVWGTWQDLGSLFNVVQSVLLFELLAHQELSLQAPFEKILAKLSDWSFGAYLTSWVFDMVFYKALEKLVPAAYRGFYWIVLLVPAVFTCSIIASAIISYLHKVMVSKCRRRALPSEGKITK